MKESFTQSVQEIKFEVFISVCLCVFATLLTEDTQNAIWNVS